MKKFNHYVLMNKAGEGTGGGGQGTGVNSATGNSQEAANTSWRSQLPPELQAEPSLQTFNDISALAKSFIHAQRTIGADKIAVPGKHATEDDWKQVFTKLGLPEKLESYELKMKEDASIDKDFIAKFKATAHSAGILPQQAQKLADWFQEVNSQSTSEVQKLKEQKVKESLEGLKSEWGAAYEKNIGVAAQVLREAGSPELLNYLDQTGLGNDVNLIKLLSKIGEKFLGEDKIVGGAQEFKGKHTPAQALVEANKILSNFDHPYHNKSHPNHKAAVIEVQELFEMAHPKKEY